MNSRKPIPALPYPGIPALPFSHPAKPDSVPNAFPGIPTQNKPDTVNVLPGNVPHSGIPQA